MILRLPFMKWCSHREGGSSDEHRVDLGEGPIAGHTDAELPRNKEKPYSRPVNLQRITHRSSRSPRWAAKMTGTFNVKAQGMTTLADIPCRYLFVGWSPKARAALASLLSSVQSGIDSIRDEQRICMSKNPNPLLHIRCFSMNEITSS